MSWAASVTGSRVHEFYAELGIELNGSGRESSVRCFANRAEHKRDDRNKSCSVSTLTGQWKCHGCNAKGGAFDAAVAKGYTVREAADLAERFGLFVKSEQKFTMGGGTQWKKWIEALQDKPKLIRRLWEVKGWTKEAIGSCALGWDGERIAFINAKPVNGQVKIVGLARYLPDGNPKMLTVAGSERTLFPRPERMSTSRPLFVVEGEPDAVSVRSAGHQAVAVPGAAAWQPGWAQRLVQFKNLIVMCDCDAQGRALAESVKRVLPWARIVDLAPDRDDGYDIGDWILEAARDDAMRWAERLLTTIGSAT
jgi:5S rRNA maturation endonuclease (ribonuclease M5)